MKKKITEPPTAPLKRGATGRRKAGVPQRTGEQELKVIIDAAPAVISYVGTDFRFRFINRECERWFGRPAEEIRGAHIRELLGNKAWKIVQPRARKALAGETVTFEQNIPYQSGGSRWVRATYTPDFDSEGHVPGFVALIHDITKSKQTEQSLHESYARLNTTMESITDAFVSFDHDWRYSYVNEQATRLLRKSQKEMLGNVVWEIFPEARRGPFYEGFTRCRLMNLPVHFEAYYAPLEAWYECHCYPSPEGMSVYFADVTERKKIEDELKKSKEELEVRVQERTADLERANKRLEEEMAERELIERNTQARNELLKLFSRTFLRHEYLDALVDLLKKWCGCQCVGIRLTGENWGTQNRSSAGFSEEYWQEEISVPAMGTPRTPPGNAGQRRKKETPSFATPGGSFICNDASLLPKSGKNRGLAPIRKACSHHGFASFAVIPIRHQQRDLGTIHLADTREDKVPAHLLAFIETVSPIIGEALYRFRVEEALIASREHLRNLTIHLQTAIEEERIKIAQQIHDDLGQTLTAVSLELARLRDDQMLSRRAQESLMLVSGLIDTAIENIHGIYSELRPQLLDHLGLTEAIKKQTAAIAGRRGIRYNLDVRPVRKKLPREVSTALFRIFQEALSNAVRHSGATEVSIRVRAAADGIELGISDNGKGASDKELFRDDSFGILGIRERAHGLGGTAEFSSRKGRGMSMTVRIPMRGRRPHV